MPNTEIHAHSLEAFSVESTFSCLHAYHGRGNLGEGIFLNEILALLFLLILVVGLSATSSQAESETPEIENLLPKDEPKDT